jgi:LysM repeat protein
MSNPNPLVPQGSVLEQQAKSRPHLRIALCIVAAHLVFLGLLLMQGCKKDEQDTATSSTELPPLDATASFQPPGAGTNDLTGLGQPPGMPGAGMGATSAPPVVPPVVPNAGFGATGPDASAMGGYAPPPVVPEPQPAATTQDYVVVKNDSFYSIGRKFGVSPTAIAKANPGVDSTRLRIGQKLVIPAPSAAPVAAVAGADSGASAATYTVKSGDTLHRIALRHGTSVNALMELNGLTTHRINIGQKLKLPSKAPAAPVVPAPSGAAPLGGPITP